MPNWKTAKASSFIRQVANSLHHFVRVKRTLAGKASLTGTLLALGAFGGTNDSSAQAYLDNQTLYSNQDPNVETRRSDHFRMVFGHYNRDTGMGGMSEAMAQGNLQMYEQMWNRWVVEMGLHDINESVTAPDGHKYRANFNFLMTFNDGGGGGAYSSMDGGGFFYAMANPGYCRWDPPSGATPHEFGHVWEGSCGGFNGSDSSGAWWECSANWMMLQFLNSYPQAGGYIWNGMYYPAHGRDYYDSWMIWEAAHDDPRYGALWVNNVWTNYNADQQAHEYIIDRMIRCDTSGSPDKAGAVKDLWGDMARKMITWDFQRKQWLAQANSTDDGTDWYFYQRCRTPLVTLPGTNGWYRPSRDHLPMEFGFNFIPLTATNGSTVTCNFQPQCDPVRQSDWRACLVAVNSNGDTSYSSLWNVGVNSITLSADQSKLYLAVIATPKPMKIADPAWMAYLTDAGLQFPYAVSFSNAVPRNVVFAKPTGVTWKSFTNAVDGTVCRNIASGATVDSTAYVSSNAMVLNSAKVRGYARIEDYAVVQNNAQVRDYAIVSGHAVVQDNAQVYGNAKVRDWARVFGYAEVYENAKVIEHGNCGDGNATTHTKVYGNAVVKGTTYVYDTSTFNGCLIMEGDSANGNGTTPTSQGVHFGWGWGQDTARFNSLSNNNYLYAQHTFEKDNAVFAMDQYGINHGFLMNGCRAEVDTVAPTRGGRVLPLNGINQYVELHNSVNDFKDTAIAVWFKCTNNAPDQRVWSMGDGSSKVMYLTPNDLETGGVRFVISTGALTYALDGPVLPANTWTHVAVVFATNANTMTLYVNGVAAASTTTALFPDSLNAPLMANANYLGRGNAGNYFQGCLDDFRVYMRSLSASEVAALYATAAPALITITPDTTAPTPNAATWLVPPTVIRDDTIIMSATPGSDDSGWVEYYFACTAGGGHDSGWVSFNKYTDAGLTPGTAYTYTVRMRDRSGNTTAASAPATAAGQSYPLATPSFSYGPVGIANGRITMTAAQVTNRTAKVEYKFDRAGKSSGWQSSPTWTDTGLTTGNAYTYSVTVRDGRGNTSSPSATVAATARDEAAPRLPMPVAHWAMLPYVTISNTVSMTAQTASDPSGVQYYFHCVSGGGPDSVWQSSSTFQTPKLADGIYVYQYKVRDTSAQYNESPYSTSYAAKITPTTGYHTYTSLSQVLTNPDDYLVSFPATVMKVYATNYYVKDLVSGAAISVEPNTSNLVTSASLALKNVIVQGHLYTRGGARLVTYASLTSNGVPALYSISGRVTNAFGAGISGATVYFADSPGASSNAIVSVTTDANGNYTNGLTAGTWYLAAAASAYNTSTDCVLVVSGSLSGVNFGLVGNAKVRGNVIRRSDGAPVVGAAVYFSRSPGASASPVFTATTDASGNYVQAVQDGTWYVAAGGAGFYPSADLTVTIAGLDVTNINFALKSSTRNIPATDRLYFSAITDSLPNNGNTGPWAQYLPAGGASYGNLGNPTVATLNGVKWVQNYRMAANTGFRVRGPLTSIPCSGVTMVTAARPTYVNPGGEARGELIDIMYDRLALAISHTDGRIMVARNGNWGTFGPAIPQSQPTVLSLVVQPNGSFTVYTNGVQAMTGGASGDFSTSMVPTGTEGFKQYVDLGRNDPDGWSSYEGYLGDVFVYTNALSAAERQQLESDMMAKFLSADYQVAASAGAGGAINPSGTVYVAPGRAQQFSITPTSGYMVTNVVVDGVSQGALSTYTFSNMAANHTITAAFDVVPVTPPTLTIAANGTGSLDISWPDSYSGQVLWTPSLGPDATWVPVGVTPAHVGSFYKVTVTPGSDAAFYGLSR